MSEWQSIETANVYKAMLRPVSFCTLPHGIRWEYVERPWAGNIHGTIRTDRPFTADEMDRFGMSPLLERKE